MEAQLIPLEGLDTTAADRVRHVRDPRKIDDYVAAMEDGAVFPAIRVYQDEAGKRHAWDGGYRIAARRQRKDLEILAIVEPGTFADALAKARLANDDHGYRRTIEDKQKIARELVEEELDRRAADPSHKLSDRELGRRANLSHTLISETAKTVKSERAAAAKQQASDAADRALILEHGPRVLAEGWTHLPSEYGSHPIMAGDLDAPYKLDPHRLRNLAARLRLLVARDVRETPRRHDVVRLADGTVLVVTEGSNYEVSGRRFGASPPTFRLVSWDRESGTWKQLLGEKWTIIQAARVVKTDVKTWIPPEGGHDWIDGTVELGGPPPAALLPEGCGAWCALSASAAESAALKEQAEEVSEGEASEDVDDEVSDQEVLVDHQQIIGGGEAPVYRAPTVEAPHRPPADERRAEGRADGAWIGRVVARLRMMEDEERQAVEAVLWPGEQVRAPSADAVEAICQLGDLLDELNQVSFAEGMAEVRRLRALESSSPPAVVVQLPATHALLAHMVELLDADDEDLARRRLAVHPRVDLHRQGSTISMDRPLDADQIRAALAEVRTWYDPAAVCLVDLSLGAELGETDPDELAATEETAAELGLHEYTGCGLTPTWAEEVEAESQEMPPAQVRADDPPPVSEPAWVTAALAPYRPWRRSKDELRADLASMDVGELSNLALALKLEDRGVVRDVVEERIVAVIEIAPSDRREQLVAQYLLLPDGEFKKLYKQNKGVSPSYRQTRQRGSEILADAVLAKEAGTSVDVW